jgi:hypothetical protein
MQKVAANTNPTVMAFGDLQKYIIRKVKSAVVQQQPARFQYLLAFGL